MNQQKKYPIRLCALSTGYDHRLLIDKADMAFEAGRFTALVGRNGAGKSTLLRTIAALRRPLSGHVEINGTDTATLSRRDIALSIGFVSTEEVRIADLKVYDVVALGRAPHTNWTGRLTATDHEQVKKALALVGMSSFADKCIANLSDGERQRVMIARALAQDTPIILLDEPTAFLDLPNKYEIFLLLKRLAEQEDKCIVCSTHDLDIALKTCHAIALIDGHDIKCRPTGEFIEEGGTERLFAGTKLTYDRSTHTICLKNQE